MEFDTSSKSMIIGVALAVVGILVLILAFALDWGVIVMVLGVLLLVVGAVVLYLKPLDGALAPKSAPARSARAAAPHKDYGGTQLGKALTFAEKKLNEKEATLPASVVEFYRGKIAACAEMVGKDEEAALISMSQVIGAIISA